MLRFASAFAACTGCLLCFGQVYQLSTFCLLVAYAALLMRDLEGQP